MKAKKVFLIAAIVIILLAVWYLVFYMGRTKVVIKSNQPVSNVVYEYENEKSVQVNNQRFNHSALAYGLYTYKFDVTADGKVFSPQIDVLKENGKAHYKITIEVNITKRGEVYDADVLCTLNGREVQMTFKDIEHNKIYLHL